MNSNMSSCAVSSSGKKGTSSTAPTTGGGGGGGSSLMKCCQAEKCSADLSDAKQYHRRHKVCELHAKAQMVVVGGIWQRFCQQCSRFHELTEFDETKRSCRRRLAGHNERRRKNSTDSPYHTEGASPVSRKRAAPVALGATSATATPVKEAVCGQVHSVQETGNFNQFQVMR